MVRVLKTYWRVRKVFKFPTPHFYIGKWVHCPTLPVWRRGRVLHLCKRKEINYYWNNTRYSHFKCGDTWVTSQHKINHDCYCTNRNKRKKFKSIRPIIKLPIWLSCWKFNHDVMWKWKYDTVRYEYPPQYTLVLFGLAFAVWFNPTYDRDKNPTLLDMHYWETLLSYTYDDECPKDYKGLTKYMGKWSYHKNDELIEYTTVQPEYFKTKWLAKNK